MSAPVRVYHLAACAVWPSHSHSDGHLPRSGLVCWLSVSWIPSRQTTLYGQEKIVTSCQTAPHCLLLVIQPVTQETWWLGWYLVFPRPHRASDKELGEIFSNAIIFRMIVKWLVWWSDQCRSWYDGRPRGLGSSHTCSVEWCQLQWCHGSGPDTSRPSEAMTEWQVRGEIRLIIHCSRDRVIGYNCHPPGPGLPSLMCWKYFQISQPASCWCEVCEPRMWICHTV